MNVQIRINIFFLNSSNVYKNAQNLINKLQFSALVTLLPSFFQILWEGEEPGGAGIALKLMEEGTPTPGTPLNMLLRPSSVKST